MLEKLRYSSSLAFLRCMLCAVISLTVFFANCIESKAASITILEQPKDVVALVGDTVDFSVDVVGNNLTYQWYYKNYDDTSFTRFETIKGYNESTLHLPIKSNMNNRYVYCEITDASGNAVNSRHAKITLSSASDDSIEVTTLPNFSFHGAFYDYYEHFDEYVDYSKLYKGSHKGNKFIYSYELSGGKGTYVIDFSAFDYYPDIIKNDWESVEFSHVILQPYVLINGERYDLSRNGTTITIDNQMSDTVFCDLYCDISFDFAFGLAEPYGATGFSVETSFLTSALRGSCCVYSYELDAPGMTMGDQILSDKIDEQGQAQLDKLEEGNILQEESNALQEENNKLQETANDLQQQANETSKSILDNVTDFFGSFFENIINTFKSLFVPEEGYFEDFFERLNDFFSEKLGVLYAPIEIFFDILYCVDYIDPNSSSGIFFPGVEWNGKYVIPPQSVELYGYFTRFPEMQEKLYFVTDLIMVGSVLWLFQNKLKEVMRN